MQKEFKNIDELFKSGLSDSETTAPAFVKKRLDKKLFGRRKYILFFLPLLAITGLLTLLLVNIRPNDLTLVDHSTKPNTVENNVLQTNKFSEKKIVNNFHQQENNKSTDNINQGTVNAVTSNTVPKKNTIKTKVTTSKKTVTNNTQSSKTSSKKGEPTILPIQNTDSDIPKSHNNKSNPNTADTVLPIKTTTTQQTDKTTKNNEKNTAEVNSNKDPIIETQNNENDTETFTESDSLIQNNVTEDNITETKTEQDSTLTDNTEDTAIQKDITLAPKPKIVDYLFSWTSGINFSKSTYSAADSSDFGYYQTNNKEKINFEHSLTANVLLKNKFLIGSGIGISQQSYNFSYNETSTSTVTTTDSVAIFDYYIYSVNDTLEQFPPIDSIYYNILDTTSSVVTTNTPFDGKSYAKYFNIPLNIGYVFTINKFMFGIQANLRYNILYKTGGQFYANNTVTNFDKSNSIFRKSYFDLAIKTDVYYELSKNLYLNGSLKYSPQLYNTYQNTTIERKLKYLHFGMGISYKL